MAGHSKWANIRHRKGAQDQKRGKIFTKIIKEITISAQLAPAASILDTLRNRSLTESKEALEPLEVEVKEISNAEGGA